ncbi:MAG: DUF4105 domain-containing protein [Paraglaciecola sp.]|uniref:Lnb N-terminal periplasmic domain-containing protein n=1 Tax=Paraglaciecola sp. TaxID=1920173 RepID=UPI0032975768
MKAVLDKGRVLSVFFYLFSFSPTVFAASYSDTFVEQFVRVMHAQKEEELYKTEFTNPRLFSSDDQYFSPEKEIAFLDKHLQLLTQQQNVASYYCRFPATYYVLQKHLSHLPSAHYQNCPELAIFIKGVNDISIVFAAGYMGNPASYFGHMFIKLGRSNIKLANETLNIGANVPENENPLAYMVKGVFGAYETQFTSTSYYKQSHVYSQLEGRDLYEYKLNLSSESVLFLSLHLYELQQANFTYYFTHRNCAYEIYRFLYAQPNMTHIGAKPLFYPVHLIAYLNEHSLIRSFEYSPSNKTKFSQLYFAAASEKRKSIDMAILKLQAKESVKVVANGIDKEIAEALLFYGYAHLNEKGDVELLNAIKKLRLFFSGGKAYDKSQFKQKDLTSRAPVTVAVSWENRNYRNGLKLVFRPAHYNQTDRPDDVSNGGKLVFFQTSLFIGDKITLDSLDIVDVHKSEIGKTGQYGDDAFEWGMKISYRNVELEGDGFEGLFSASGYFGDVYFLGNGTWLQYGIKGGVRNNVANNGSVFIAPTLSLTANFNTNTRFSVTVGREFFGDNVSNLGNIVKLTGTSKVNHYSAVSASYDKDLYGKTLSFGFNYYF